jgi:adenylyltransferase/sulfurtransferase
MNGIPQVTVTELKKRMDAGQPPVLIDVREPNEYQFANLGGTLIPMNTLPARLDEIPRDQPVVVHCKAGGRSQMVCEFLARSGYSNVANLAGGILAWSREIDPTVPQY